jgi:hypothetical protein
MNSPPLKEVTDGSFRHHYEVKVRGTTELTFLWGSEGIAKNITFDKPLLLHIRNDIFGETITIGTRVAAGTQTTIGTLKAGECVSIPIQELSGVFATCTLDSVVGCLIR